MTNAEMITALRCCASLDTPCKGLCPYYGVEYCQTKKDLDAADAIEHLNHLVDLNTERCEALRKQLREANESYEKHLNEIESQVPRWIPVTERLPDFHEEGKEDGFSPVVAISEIYIFRLLPFSNGTIEWRDPWDFFSKNYEVTHWMPLPEPPEVEE